MRKAERSAAPVRAVAAPAPVQAPQPAPGPLHHSARLSAQRVRIAAAFGPVAQCVKVGGADTGVMMLASQHFNDSTPLWNAARKVLQAMKDSDKDYADLDEILSTVRADPDVAKQLLAVQQQKAQQEAEQKRKAESPTIYTAFGKDGDVTDYDIEKGRWQSLNRPGKVDYELVVELANGPVYSFHVHPPHFSGQRPIPGEVMRGRSATGTQTSTAVIDCILKHHPLPAKW